MTYRNRNDTCDHSSMSITNKYNKESKQESYLIYCNHGKMGMKIIEQLLYVTESSMTYKLFLQIRPTDKTAYRAANNV